MTDRTIRISIDPTGARSGAKQVTKSLEDIRAAGGKAAGGINRSSSAIEQAKVAAIDYAGATGRARDEMGRFVAGAGQAERATRGVGSAMSAAKTAAVGLVAGLGVRGIIGYADAWTSAESKLRLVTSSSLELNSVQKQLFASAQANRSSFGATVDLYAGLARSTKDLGVSQSQLMTVTNAVSQAMVISGADAQAASGAIRQLSQAFASGTLRGDEFNSVNEAAPRIMEAVAKSIGVTRGQLREMAADGKLTSEALLKALTESAGTIGSEFGSMSMTVGQSLTQLDNAFGKFVASLSGSTGAASGLASIISLIAENMSILASASIAVGTALAVNAFGPAVVGAVGTVATAIRGATGAMAALNVAVRANPFGLLATAVGLAAGGLAYLATGSSDAASASKVHADAIERVTALSREANGAAETMVKNLKDEATQAANAAIAQEQLLQARLRAQAETVRSELSMAVLAADDDNVFTSKTFEREVARKTEVLGDLGKQLRDSEDRVGILADKLANFGRESGGSRGSGDGLKIVVKKGNTVLAEMRDRLEALRIETALVEGGNLDAVNSFETEQDAINLAERAVKRHNEANKDHRATLDDFLPVAREIVEEERNLADARDEATKATKEVADAQSELSHLIEDTLPPAEKYRAKLEEIEQLRPFADTPEEIRAIDRALKEVRLEEFGRRNKEAADQFQEDWGNSIDAVPSVPKDEDPKGVEALGEAIGGVLDDDDNVDVTPYQRKAA